MIRLIRNWIGIGRKPQIELLWRAQLYVHPFTGNPLDPDNPNAVYHFADSPAGSFEICEMEGNFLLRFPRSMGLPAELLHDLAEAKARALSSLKDAS